MIQKCYRCILKFKCALTVSKSRFDCGHHGRIRLSHYPGWLSCLSLFLALLVVGCSNKQTSELSDTTGGDDQSTSQQASGDGSSSDNEPNSGSAESTQSDANENAGAAPESTNGSGESTNPGSDTIKDQKEPADPYAKPKSDDKKNQPEKIVDTSIAFAEPLEIPTLQNWLSGDQQPVPLATWKDENIKLTEMSLLGMDYLSDPYVSCQWSEELVNNATELEIRFRAPGQKPIKFASFVQQQGQLSFQWDNIEGLAEQSNLINEISNADLAATINSLRWNALRMTFAHVGNNQNKTKLESKLLSRRPAQFNSDDLTDNLLNGNSFLNRYVRLNHLNSSNSAGKAQLFCQLASDDRKASRFVEASKFEEQQIAWALVGTPTDDGYVISIATNYLPFISTDKANKVLLERGVKTNQIGSDKKDTQQSGGKQPAAIKNDPVRFEVARITYTTTDDGSFALGKQIELLVPDGKDTNETTVQPVVVPLVEGKITEESAREVTIAIKKQLRLWQRQNKSNQDKPVPGVSGPKPDFEQKIDRCMAFLQWYPNRTTKFEFQLLYDPTEPFAGKDDLFKRPIVVISN